MVFGHSNQCLYQNCRWELLKVGTFRDSEISLGNNLGSFRRLYLLKYTTDHHNIWHNCWSLYFWLPFDYLIIICLMLINIWSLKLWDKWQHSHNSIFVLILSHYFINAIVLIWKELKIGFCPSLFLIFQFVIHFEINSQNRENRHSNTTFPS